MSCFSPLFKDLPENSKEKLENNKIFNMAVRKDIFLLKAFPSSF